MKKVSIPYEIRGTKLYMPPVVWPRRCPCCGRKATLSEYKLKHIAKLKQWSTTTTTSSSGYSLEWNVPYCELCENHAEWASELFPWILVIGTLLTLVFGIVVQQIVPILLFAAGYIIIGVILYQVLLRVMVFRKMTDTCANHGYAVLISDTDKEVFFHFYDAAYAEQFANMNHTELLDDTPPRLVGGMRWKR